MIRLKSDPTSLVDLPNKAAHLVLKHLSQKDIRNLALCSKRTHKLVEFQCGTIVSLGGSVTPWLHQPFWTHDEGVNIIQNSVVKSCHVGNFLEPSRARLGLYNYVYHKLSYYLWSNRLPMEFKYPFAVQQLKFQGNVSPKYFEGLTVGVYNLKQLHIHWRTFSCLSLGVLEPLHFPNLTSLEVFGDYDIQVVTKLSYKRLCKFTDNFLHFLQNVFISLQVFKLALPDHIRCLMMSTYPLLVFLERHSSSLVIFKLELITISYTGFPQSAQSQALYEHTHKLFVRMEEVGAKMNLKSLCLISLGIGHHTRTSYLDHWCPFILKQNCLKEIQGIGVYFCIDYLPILTMNNFSTIKRIDVCICQRDNSSWVPFDCRILADCLSLQELLLEGLDFPECILCQDQSGLLVNVNLLPQSLTYLSLKRIPVPHETVNYLCLQLHNLRHLRLISTRGYTIQGMGVSTQVISSIMERKHLKTFAVSATSITYEEKQECLTSLFFRELWPQILEYRNYHKTSTGTDDTIEIRLIGGFYRLWTIDGPWIPKPM